MLTTRVPCAGGKHSGHFIPRVVRFVKGNGYAHHIVERFDLISTGGGRCLKSGIDRLAFQSQDAKDALMDAAERFAANEPFEGFDSQAKLPQGQRSFGRESALTSSDQIVVVGVIRPLEDPEIFSAAALDGRLHQSLFPARDELKLLEHHPFAAGFRELSLPGRYALGLGRVGHVHNVVRRSQQDLRIVGAKATIESGLTVSAWLSYSPGRRFAVNSRG